MSRIEETFRTLRAQGRSALIPFLMTGDPDLNTTEALILKMAEWGADLIELGIPFSDPLADGPVIQASSHRALQGGIKPADLFSLAYSCRNRVPPLVILTYFNPLLQYGVAAFAEDCKKSGIAGVVIPDLPPEEAASWVAEARKRDIDTIFLASPTSPPERLKVVSHWSRGFIYYVSVTGVTGPRGELPHDLESAVRETREQSQKPVAVGFGISTPDQAKEVSRLADGVIVGSALVKIVEERAGLPDLVDRVGAFISSLAAAIK